MDPNDHPTTPSPSDLPSDDSPETASPFEYRGNGKVARLPKAVGDQTNVLMPTASLTSTSFSRSTRMELRLPFALPAGTSARDIALQLLSQDGSISSIPASAGVMGLWGVGLDWAASGCDMK